MFKPPHPISYREQLALFLKEDWSTQDWTTLSIPERDIRGKVFAKSRLVLAGLPVAEELLWMVDPAIDIQFHASDGDRVEAGEAVMDLEGPCHGILMAERVMLNLLQRLSGTATLTRAFVDEVEGTRTRILDTRKTTPGLKLLEKYAVRCGGGCNHRHTLGDGVLLKENHIASVGGIRAAVEGARKTAPMLVKIEVEAETLEQVRECLAIQDVDGLLLDNMSLEELVEAVKLRDASGRNLFLEASGNMSLDRVCAVADTGVDFISVGALTHSAPAADLSLRLEG